MGIKDRIKELEKDLNDFSFTEEEAQDLRDFYKTIRGMHPEIAELFGKNYTARDIALFLCRVNYLWNSKGKKPFHKYNSPCATSSFGDSWEEELAMSGHDLRVIKDVVATRVRNVDEAIQTVTHGTEIKTLVAYHKNSDRVTFWYFNEKLYTKLRGFAQKKIEANCVSSKWAQVRETQVGPSEGDSSAYIQNNSYNIKEEKEINKEKEEDFEKIFETAATKLSKNPATEKAKARAKEKANKNSKPLTLQQQKIIENKNKGHTLPLDFLPDESIMLKLIESGYIRNQLVEEAGRMVKWYQINNPDIKRVNWGLYFETEWVPKSQVLEKNGKILNKSANTERAERLGELARSSVFDRVGTTSLSELADRLRGRGT